MALTVLGLAAIVIIVCIAGFSLYAQRGRSRGPEAGASGSTRLTKLVKRVLDIVVLFVFIGVILWPIAAIALGSNLFFEHGARNVDVFIGFTIDPTATGDRGAQPGSLSEMSIHGHSQVDFVTPSQIAWYLSAATTELFGVLLLFGLIQLRALFASLTGGESFAEENPARIRRIGLALVAWYAVLPLLQYAGGRTVLGNTEFSTAVIELHPAFELGIAGLLAGLATIVLAGVYREAVNIHKDQSLTI